MLSTDSYLKRPSGRSASRTAFRMLVPTSRGRTVKVLEMTKSSFDALVLHGEQGLRRRASLRAGVLGGSSPQRRVHLDTSTLARPGTLHHLPREHTRPGTPSSATPRGRSPNPRNPASRGSERELGAMPARRGKRFKKTMPSPRRETASPANPTFHILFFFLFDTIPIPEQRCRGALTPLFYSKCTIITCFHCKSRGGGFVYERKDRREWGEVSLVA